MRAISVAETLTVRELVDLLRDEAALIITSDGQPVARLVPAVAGADVEGARAAVARIRERARVLRLGNITPEEWKCFRDEGRT